MAFLSDTLLTDAISNINGQLERQDLRMPEYGVMRTVDRQTTSVYSILSNDAREKIRNSQGRDVKVEVYNDVDVTIKNVRSCTIDDFDNTTEQVTLTSAEIVADISMIPAQYKNNSVAYSQDLQRKLIKVGQAFTEETENLIVAAWDLAKSQVYNSPLIPTMFPLVGDAIQVSDAQKQMFFNYLTSIMQSDNFKNRPYDVIGNTTLSAIVREWGNQGNANDKNTAFQFGDFNFEFSNNIPVTLNAMSTAYCMPQGTTGLELRNTAESAGNGYNAGAKEWYRTVLPIFDKQVSVYFDANCSDQSARLTQPHLVNTPREAWQFSTELFIVTPKYSTPLTKATGIKKMDFLFV